jgi:hypothetical protein
MVIPISAFNRNEARDARAVARAAVAEWASSATEMVDARIAEHKRSGDFEGRAFWQRVKQEITRLDSESMAALCPEICVARGATKMRVWTHLRAGLRRLRVFAPLNGRR